MEPKLLFTKLFKIILFLFLFPFLLLNAQEKSLEKLIEDSNIIVVGNVKAIKSVWEEGNIWTYITVGCQQIIKGNDKGSNEVTIRSLGGKVGEITQLIHGAPKFEVGEILLGFLKKDKKGLGLYYCIGGGAGKYKYENGIWAQKNSKQPETFINKIKTILNSK